MKTITAKVGRDGRLTLPREIRRRLGIKEGHRVAFVIQGGQVTLCPLNQTIFDFRGSVHVEGPQDFEAIRQTVHKEIASRNAPSREDNDA